MALSFDDGPLPVGHTFLLLLYTSLNSAFSRVMQASDNLLGFLKDKQVKATHFFIGTNILRNWNQFNTAFQVNQDDIAGHTWTHPHMTTLSNADVVAQLGWTLQVIYDSTGGRLTRYWRPPYGDVDVRVTSIAREVFGLTTVVWNQEYAATELYDVACVSILFQHGRLDLWSPWRNHRSSRSGIFPAGALRYHLFSAKTRALSLTFVPGSQTPGLVILEHELSDAAVNSFIAAYPLIKQYNWNLQSLASVIGPGPYQNAIGVTGQPTSVALTAGGNGGAGLTATATSSSTPPSPATTSDTSTSSSQATALPDTGVKTSGAAPGLRSPPLTLSLSALALVLSFCLF
jgi:peptidoglycan/xylan/chitin deacetylase (PgdA/CDA1 family)